MGRQIDKYMLRIVRQINHPEERIIDINLRVGVKAMCERKHAMFLSFADYLQLLQEYEKKDLKLSPKEVIVAPILDSRVILMEQSISISDSLVCFVMLFVPTSQLAYSVTLRRVKQTDIRLHQHTQTRPLQAQGRIQIFLPLQTLQPASPRRDSHYRFFCFASLRPATGSPERAHTHREDRCDGEEEE